MMMGAYRTDITAEEVHGLTDGLKGKNEFRVDSIGGFNFRLTNGHDGATLYVESTKPGIENPEGLSAETVIMAYFGTRLGRKSIRLERCS
jgi:hypothetical protein